MSDRGIPLSFRHMHGFGSHSNGSMLLESIFVKYLQDESRNQKSRESISRRNCWENPDFHIEDLHNAIENQEFPSWTLSVQIIPYADVNNERKHF